MFTDISGAILNARSHVNREGNWVRASKLFGDCAKQYHAASTLRNKMAELGEAVDGQKYLLSLAVKCTAN